jgi:AcrR family transcriptional regulator
MVWNEEMALPQGMKIAQLCKESGLTRSTIHHYVNIGLLHRPRQAGLNLRLFDETHLNRLRQIRRLRENERLPLAQIRELLDRVEPQEDVQSMPETGVGRNGEVDSGDVQAEGRARDQGRKNREMILDGAIKLFSEQGYENTKISDVTDALHMGKGTFYVYFKNKKELFMECIDRLTVTIVPKEAWAEIRSEKGYVSKTRLRGAAFLNAFPGFRGILNLLRIALGGPDPALALKAKEAFRILSAPIAKDLSRAVSEGRVRSDVDVELFAFLQLMLAEGVGYWLMMDPEYSVEEGLDALLDIFLLGLREPNNEEPGGSGSRADWGELRDSKGVTTQLRGIVVNGKPLLPGRIGDGEMGLDLTRTRKVEILREGEAYLARATLKDGNDLVLEIDGGMILSAETPCGPFHISLDRVVSISYGREGTEIDSKE